MAYATFTIKGYNKGLSGIGNHIDRTGKNPKKTGIYEDEEERKTMEEVGFNIDPTRTHLNEEWL